MMSPCIMWILFQFPGYATAQDTAWTQVQVYIWRWNPEEYNFYVSPPPRWDQRYQQLDEGNGEDQGEEFLYHTLLTGAQVTLGNQPMLFDSTLHCYYTWCWSGNSYQLKIQHPAYHQIVKEIRVAGQGPVMETVMAKHINDFTVFSLGKEYFSAPDPRHFQKPSTPESVRLSGLLHTTGAVIGRAGTPSASARFREFVKQHKITQCLWLPDQYQFQLAPEPGQSPEAFYSSIIPLLMAEDWVTEVGPFVAALPSMGTYGVSQQIYIEFRSDTPQAVKDSLMNRTVVTSIHPPGYHSPYYGRPGVMAETDPALGLEILRLAEELMRSPAVITADVQLIDFSFPAPLD